MTFLTRFLSALFLAGSFTAPVLAAGPMAAPAPAEIGRPDDFPVSPWLKLAPEKRREMVQSWLRLPEETRPPFPAFRDSYLGGKDKPGKTAEKAEIPAPPAASKK